MPPPLALVLGATHTVIPPGRPANVRESVGVKPHSAAAESRWQHQLHTHTYVLTFSQANGNNCKEYQINNYRCTPDDLKCTQCHPMKFPVACLSFLPILSTAVWPSHKARKKQLPFASLPAAFVRAGEAESAPHPIPSHCLPQNLPYSSIQTSPAPPSPPPAPPNSVSPRPPRSSLPPPPPPPITPLPQPPWVAPYTKWV